MLSLVVLTYLCIASLCVIMLMYLLSAKRQRTRIQLVSCLFAYISGWVCVSNAMGSYTNISMYVDMRAFVWYLNQLTIFSVGVAISNSKSSGESESYSMWTFRIMKVYVHFVCTYMGKLWIHLYIDTVWQQKCACSCYQQEVNGRLESERNRLTLKCINLISFSKPRIPTTVVGVVRQ